MKQILRAFRKETKVAFQQINGLKHYNWIDKTIRKKNREMFVDEFKISEDFYDKNESIFFCLVHSTRNSSDLDKLDMKVLPFVQIMNDVCG